MGRVNPAVLFTSGSVAVWGWAGGKEKVSMCICLSWPIRLCLSVVLTVGKGKVTERETHTQREDK